MLSSILPIKTNSSDRQGAILQPLELPIYLNTISNRIYKFTYNQYKNDVTPLLIEKIILDDRTLLFKSVATFYPEFDKTQHLLYIKDLTLGIDVCAENRAELYEALLREIEVLWFEYALEQDANLTAGALALKNRLLENIEEVLDAA